MSIQKAKRELVSNIVMYVHATKDKYIPSEPWPELPV